MAKPCCAPEIIALYRRFFDAFSEAVRRGSTAEDLTHGHSLMADPLAREIQLQFPDVAAKNLPQLRDVLRNSSDDEQRAIAAGLIGYAPRKIKSSPTSSSRSATPTPESAATPPAPW